MTIPALPVLMPALSVLMSVYNDERYVGLAIDSILTQSFDDFEFLVIDDRSTDASAAIIAQRAALDPRIRILPSPAKGRVPALGALLAAASAPLVAIMDSDDVCTADRFEKQMAFLAAHPDHGVIGCECSHIGPDGEAIQRPQINRPLDHAGLVANLESRPLINHNAVMMARDAVRSIGGYRSAYRHAEDYDLWLRLSQVTRMANLPEKLVQYRFYPEQVSTAHVVMQTRNAAIAWLAHGERLAGRPDPTGALDELPPLDRLDGMFGPGSTDYVRRRVIDRILYSPEALTGDGWGILLDYARTAKREPRLWRAAARMLRSGLPLRAARLATTLVIG